MLVLSSPNTACTVTHLSMGSSQRHHIHFQSTQSFTRKLLSMVPPSLIQPVPSRSILHPLQAGAPGNVLWSWVRVSPERPWLEVGGGEGESPGSLPHVLSKGLRRINDSGLLTPRLLGTGPSWAGFYCSCSLLLPADLRVASAAQLLPGPCPSLGCFASCWALSLFRDSRASRAGDSCYRNCGLYSQTPRRGCPLHRRATQGISGAGHEMGKGGFGQGVSLWFSWEGMSKAG